MASSILTGDRRYGTVRGKFTVLGKVPKPINLPSQKLENRGLDPNVEIVPRGTLTWGSRAATPNAWASSASSSPHADENANSPVRGRPSSSGSGPRPSTSDSDKSNELNSKAWGQNSRPSSASGSFASNQLSLAPSRPRSAESRPVCSQLSRFAENSTENTVAWGSRTNSSGYAPSSGDFPPLGSENNSESHMQRGHSSHGRPASASGSSTQNERPELPCGDVNADRDSRNVDMQLTDSYPYGHGDIPLDIEKRKRDSQQGWAYPIADMPHPQFGNWHGPEVNTPDEVWHKGTAGGPFRPVGSAVTYPIEHFAYFRPQIQGLLPNPQSIPKPGGGLGCYYPENRDMHFPRQPPDSYMISSQQIITLTPGVQQTPQPIDGCHDSRANYFNSINSEVPCIGSPPDVGYLYDEKSNAHFRKFHMSYSSRAPNTDKEQAKSDQVDEIHEGQYVVLLKQDDDGGDHIVHEKREQSILSNCPHFEGSNQQEATSCQGNWRANSRNGEASSVSPTPGTGRSSEPVSDWEGHSSDDAYLTKSLGDLNDVTDESWMKKESNGTAPMHDEEQYSAIKRDSSLMEKIEVLNNKARIADHHIEGGQLSSKDAVKTLKDVNLQAKAPEKNTCIGDTLDGSCLASGIAQPASHKKRTSNEDTECRKVVLQPSESQVFKSTKSGGLENCRKTHHQIRRKGHFVQSGLDCRAKSGFTGSQGDDELVKRIAGRNSTKSSSPRDKDNYTVSEAPDFSMSQDIIEKQVLPNATNAEDGSLATKFAHSKDHHEIQAIATQHSKQLEERQVKELNTKSLTELEGLNRHIAHGFNQNFNNTTTTSKDFDHMQAFKSDSTPKTVGSVDESQRGNSAGNNSGSTSDPSLRSQYQSLSWEQDANNSGDVTRKSSRHFHESKFPKHKNVGYRRKQSTIQEKIQGQQPFSVMNVGRRSSVDVSMHHLECDSVLKIEDLPTQPKKKTNRTSKSKLKADEVSSRSSIQSSANNEENLENGPLNIGKTQSESLVEIKPDSAQSVIETLKNQCSRDEVGTPSTEELLQETDHYFRGSNHWKQQSSRPMRNQRGIKTGYKFHGSEAVMWAPVRPQNKTIQSDGTTLNHNNQIGDNFLEKDEHDTQNVAKTKRAEMERYVPKPAVKERLYQNSQQNLPCINQTAPCEVMVEPDFDGKSSVKQEFGSDATNGEVNKSNRRGKMHASWCQRHSAGLPPVSQSFCNEGSSSADVAGHLQPQQHHQSRGDSRAGSQLVYDDVRDKKLINDTGSAFPLTDINGLNCGTNVEKDETPALESAMLGNENARFSHEQKRWQPKFHSYPHSTGRGKRGMRSQRVASQGQRFDKEFRSQGTGNSLENVDANYSARITGGIEMRIAENQEADHAVPLNSVKTDPAELLDKLYNEELLRQDNQQEQPVSSAMCQHGTNNGHYGRGQGATYRAQYGGQDATMQNPNFSRGRKIGSQFEYQQIGSSDKPNDYSQQNFTDLEKHDSPRVHQTKNRGRGRNYYRHHGGGNRQFYVQTSRTAVCVTDQKNLAE
ncbi:protein MODIFIER OF SNC1 1-like isoform X2 [Dioscorea cayenensis subsp. rotundata]|uniref:Protein MODIFIER OF SNC1 1-like isoform X2 n=1 Tax=Dioscorea cayennensis subsp. rotundata TaxID=55577 RepID=A0AB40BIB3_DIOCR|nr:protein MODIFIER OF SNC1 1-like isoform X2 [Dioscorea cayenensis subsp. rotundata]